LETAERLIEELEFADPSRARSASTDQATARLRRGVKYHQQGDFELALSDYSAVVEMFGAPVDQKAWAVFNRTFSAIPQTDLDAYLDAYRGYNQRISLVTLWWIVESVGWILGAWGLKRLIIAFNFRRL
jgi:hypothetical protein